AAILNHNHNKEHNENIGFFGFFESIQDKEVAHALFDAARDWLTQKGVDAIRGPANPSVNDEYGMLIDGFDKSPAIMMPYNPPYYPEFVESYGFRKARDLNAWGVYGERVITEKLRRGTELVKERYGFTFRTINFKDFENEVKIIRELYIKAWERNWGEVPMTEEEFRYAAADMKMIADPDCIVIAELEGKPVGFGLSLPDINQVLVDNKGGYLLPALVRLKLFWKKKIKRVRIIILGALEEYRHTGIGGALFYETGMHGMAKGYYEGEASWILEDNVMMNRGAELMQGEITKRYRVYQMPIARGGSES
ncbi:MAG: hypothetical protein WBG80_12255, partial [Bacteroidota bacterium]